MSQSRHKLKQEEVLIIGVAAILLAIALINLNFATNDSLNQISGNVASRVNISSFLAKDCDMVLEPGLNLVSFFCITFDTDKSLVIGNLTNLNAIFEYQEGSSTDKWKSYNPNLPFYVVQDLSTMSRAEGYWIQMNDVEVLNLSGGLRVPTTIPLQTGWNLVGYPTNATKQANDSFSTVSGGYSEARAFNATTQAFLSHIPPATGGLTHTAPGQGFWLNVTNAGVWIVG